MWSVDQLQPWLRLTNTVLIHLFVFICNLCCVENNLLLMTLFYVQVMRSLLVQNIEVSFQRIQHVHPVQITLPSNTSRAHDCFLWEKFCELNMNETEKFNETELKYRSTGIKFPKKKPCNNSLSESSQNREVDSAKKKVPCIDFYGPDWIILLQKHTHAKNST